MKFPQQHIHDSFLADSGEYLENYQYLAHKWQTQGLSPAEHYAFAHLTPPQLSPTEDETRYLHHLCESARGGYLHAWYKLSFIFEYGDYGVTPNPPLAERLLQLCFKKTTSQCYLHHGVSFMATRFSASQTIIVASRSIALARRVFSAGGMLCEWSLWFSSKSAVGDVLQENGVA